MDIKKVLVRHSLWKEKTSFLPVSR